MSAPILETRGLVKTFGGFIALNGIDFTLAPGERVGLIGPNGSGKSSLVNCLTGVLTANRGAVLFEGKDITAMPSWRRARGGLARSSQIPRPFRHMSVRENIEVPLRFIRGLTHGREIAAAAQHVLEEIGLGAKSASSPSDLTQVDLRKLELGRALAARPKVLIADEAMAGLSDVEVDEILTLLHRLNAEGISIVLIEHIMRAVMAFSMRLVVIVAGVKIADGAPADVMRMDEVERAYLGQ
jgi:branched-chain amino acid transport system ATP-binding protein